MAAEPLVRVIHQYNQGPYEPVAFRSQDGGLYLQDRDGTRYYLSSEALRLVMQKKGEA